MTVLLLPIFFVQLDSRFAPVFRWTYGLTFLFFVAMTRSVGAYVVCVLCLMFVLAIKTLARLSQNSAISVGTLFAGVVLFAAYFVFENSGITMHH